MLVRIHFARGWKLNVRKFKTQRFPEAKIFRSTVCDIFNIYMQNLKLLKSVWHSFEKVWTTRHNTRTARHDHTKLYCGWRNSTNVTSPLHEKLPGYPIFRDFSEIKRMHTTVCARRSSSPLFQIGTPGYEASTGPTTHVHMQVQQTFSNSA